MKNKNEEFDVASLLSSCAVFASMHNRGLSLYDLLYEFILNAVLTENKFIVNESELRSLLIDNYSFDIPEVVLKKCLKREKFRDLIISQEKGYYTFNKEIKSNAETIRKNIQKTVLSYQNALNDISEYICGKFGIANEDSLALEENVKKYLIGDHIDEHYEKYISSYFLERNNNMSLFNEIKEGYILYKGLSLTSIANGWTYPIEFLLSTENIFSVVKYNSPLSNERVSDFLNLIKEINAKKEYIKLSYTSFVKKEIDSFFGGAERIIEQKGYYDPSKDAMRHIIESCDTASDVEMMKTHFFNELKKINITERKDDYYEIEKTDYNLVDETIARDFISQPDNKDFRIEEIFDEQKNMSYIYSLRGESVPKSITTCRFLFLSEKKLSRLLACFGAYRENNSFPLVLSINDVFVDLWLYQYQGFPKGNKPITLDVVFRAKEVLASYFSDKVSKEYEKLKIKYEKKEISEQDAIKFYQGLKKKQIEQSKSSKEDFDANILCMNDLYREIEEDSIREKKMYEETKDRLKKEEEKSLNLQKKINKFKIGKT